MTTHCGALELKKQYLGKIDFEYIYYFLKNKLKEYAVGQQNKRLTLTELKKINIPIPVDNQKNIDTLEQRKIVDTMKLIEQIRFDLVNKLHALKNSNVMY